MDQPPIGIEERLHTYLMRLQQTVEAINRYRDIPVKYTSLPAKPMIGRIYYFSNTVGVTITQEGYWGYTSLGWVLLG